MSFVLIIFFHKERIWNYIKKISARKIEKWIFKKYKENLSISIIFILLLSFFIAFFLTAPITNFISSKFSKDKKELTTFPFTTKEDVKGVDIDIDSASIFAVIFSVLAAGVVVMMSVLKENDKKEKEKLQAFIGFEPVPVQDFFTRKTKEIFREEKDNGTLKFRKGSRVVELDKVEYVKEIERYVYNILRKKLDNKKKKNESHPLLFVLTNRAEVGVLPISVDIIFKKIDLDEVDDKNNKKVDKKRKVRLACGYAIKEDMKKYGLLSPYPHEDFLFMAATKATNKEEITLKEDDVSKSIEILQGKQEEAKNSFLEYQAFYKEIIDCAKVNKGEASFLIIVTFKILGDEEKYSKAFEATFKLEEGQDKKIEENKSEKDNNENKDESKSETEEKGESEIGYIEVIAPILNEEKIEEEYGLDDIKGSYDNFISRKY